MTESELALKFIDYFSDCDIYKEVPAYGVVDIVAVKGIVKIAIEVKCNLNFDVISQANKNRPLFNYSYIAIPVNKYVHHMAKEICKKYGIGILGYNKNGMIKEYISPRLNRNPCRVELHEYMKRSEAGSQNNRITAFGYFVEVFTNTVKKYKDGIAAKDLFEKLEFQHYRTVGVFKSSVVKYCRDNVIKNINFIDGKFHYTN